MSARSAARIVVAERALASVRRGHPWIFREQISEAGRSIALGSDVIVESSSGERVGRALFSPDSPIAARVWSLDAGTRIDRALFLRRMRRAADIRRSLISNDTEAYRLLHGEGDRTPGVVVDRYGHVAVMRLDGAAIALHERALVEALAELGPELGITSIGVRSVERGVEGPKVRSAFGPAIPEEIVVREHGVPFVVDLARGQKTGAFLDQRENRRRVGRLAEGRRVLNLFSYAGGFSLHAAIGGARHVTSVDVAAAAHATAQRSFKLAGVDPTAHSFVTADVWTFLDRAKARGDRWDLIVSDPPNMAPSEAAKSKAVAAYRKLHAACVAVLGDGGVFCAASCSSHVTLEDFLGTLDDASLSGGASATGLRVVETAGAGIDHPTLPAFPEGRYLKFVVLA